MSQKPKIHSINTVAQSRLFHIQAIDLEFSNGETRTYERLKPANHGAVLIVPVLDDDTILLVKEYAVGIEDYALGLPKGLIEKEESVLDAANRELMEEIGYGSKQLTQLKSLSLAPGYMSHQTHIVLARDLYENKLPGDEPEPIEVVPCPLSELDTLLSQSNLTEARSIAALYLARDHLRETNT